MRKISSNLRRKLKKPLGKIAKQDKIRTRGKIITVGDMASYELASRGSIPDLIIYDKKVRRKPVVKKISKFLDSIKCDTIFLRNPRGTISEEAWIAIEEGLKRKSKIVVSGEEDLLVLPAVMLAKNGSIVLYGQPGRGMVLIKINNKKKKQIKDLLDEMEVIV